MLMAASTATAVFGAAEEAAMRFVSVAMIKGPGRVRIERAELR
jgi:hypothetical protein